MYNCDLQCNEAQLWQRTFNCKEVLQRSTFYSQQNRRLNGRFIGLNTLFTQSWTQLLLSGTPDSRWHLPQQIPMVSLSTLIFHYCVPTSASIWTIDLISVVVAKTIILGSRLPFSLLLFQSGVFWPTILRVWRMLTCGHLFERKQSWNEDDIEFEKCVIINWCRWNCQTRLDG